MISTYTVTGHSGSAVLLKFGTAALMRLERHYDKPISEIMNFNGKAVGAETVVRLLGEAANDGAGCSEDEAIALVDDLGGMMKAMEGVGKAIELAFPAPKAPAEGEGAPAGKSKKPAK